MPWKLCAPGCRLRHALPVHPGDKHYKTFQTMSDPDLTASRGVTQSVTQFLKDANHSAYALLDDTMTLNKLKQKGSVCKGKCSTTVAGV